jgi:hypothetical protein
MIGLTVAALTVFGASMASAAPAHRKPHQVCKVVKSHHHAKRVCRWVR